MIERRETAVGQRPSRLAPFGHDLKRIHWSPHAKERYFQRLHGRLSKEQVEEHIRNPVGKKKDELDRVNKDRILRWSMVDIDGRKAQLRVVLKVRRAQRPDTVEVITVIQENAGEA